MWMIKTRQGQRQNKINDGKFAAGFQTWSIYNKHNTVFCTQALFVETRIYLSSPACNHVVFICDVSGIHVNTTTHNVSPPWCRGWLRAAFSGTPWEGPTESWGPGSRRLWGADEVIIATIMPSMFQHVLCYFYNKLYGAKLSSDTVCMNSKDFRIFHSILYRGLHCRRRSGKSQCGCTCQEGRIEPHVERKVDEI
jgi:hypothetical protein